MTALTPAMLNKVADRFTAAIKAQEKYAAEHAEDTNSAGRRINVDKDGNPYRGIMVATSWGPKPDTFVGKFDAVKVLEKTLEELKIAVTPYTYNKAEKRATGTLLEVLDALQAEKKLAVVSGRGLRIYDPSMINSVNGKAVKVVEIPDTKSLF